MDASDYQQIIAKDSPLRLDTSAKSQEEFESKLACDRPVRWELALPQPHGLVWAHSVCSRAELADVLADESRVNAIETDIQMGFVFQDGDVDPTRFVAIHAHPPTSSSDLTFPEFLRRCVDDGKRHLKLDFKEADALEKCFSILSAALPQLQRNGQTVWINADVVPGPGCRSKKETVPGKTFMDAWARLVPGVPLSLGWTCAVAAMDRYTKEDVARMLTLHEFGLKAADLRAAPTVFAVNLRTAFRNLKPLIQLLNKVDNSELLFWTGTKELAVAPSVVAKVNIRLNKEGMVGRFGFDCQVASNNWAGYINDVTVVGVGHPHVLWFMFVLVCVTLASFTYLLRF